MGPMRIDAVLDASPLMAVVVIEEAQDAPDLARALLGGGVISIEVTLRTPAALEAIRRIAGEVPQALIGAGTVLTPKDLHAAAEAGAGFAVSPGSTRALLEAGRDGPIPLLPGAATASEIMEGLGHGYSAFKLFPASAIGGPAALKALSGPFAGVRWCPTGGITAASAPTYLALRNVPCVGGSWVAPPELLKSRDWPGVERLARQSVERLR